MKGCCVVPGRPGEGWYSPGYFTVLVDLTVLLTSALMSGTIDLKQEAAIALLQPTFGTALPQSGQMMFLGRTNVSELFLNSAACGSVQPVNQKAIRGRASGEDDRNLRLVPAFNRSVGSPLKITRRRQRREQRDEGPPGRLLPTPFT